ncbi:hypothetical protein AK812_SmicGene21652 [Symbiodinium microadriaticum]|uniref:Uncharacterized protein n=1 Tax=Symbiodinium microadriaticum TaxID=2951 RepID=A0A1Q9DLT8_SYMMI|nr:hypothetical protein AK812_SmicGene21652 [Symbiodinium microadriaticum]
MSSSIWAAQPAKASTRSFSATEPRVEEETGTGLLNYHDMASATDSDTVVATASAADTEDASEKEGAFPVHTLEGDYWGRFLENVPRNLRVRQIQSNQLSFAAICDDGWKKKAPGQWRVVKMAMLAKNAEIERPIGWCNVIYKAWLQVRFTLITKWLKRYEKQENLQGRMRNGG